MNLFTHLSPSYPPLPSSAEPKSFAQAFPQIHLQRELSFLSHFPCHPLLDTPLISKSPFSLFPGFISSRGSGLPAEALALAFLSIGSIQLSYLHHRSLLGSLSNPSSSALSSTSLVTARKYTSLSNALFDSSLGLVRASMAFMSRDEATVETLSGTCSLLLMNRELLGGGGYEESL